MPYAILPHPRRAGWGSWAPTFLKSDANIFGLIGCLVDLRQMNRSLECYKKYMYKHILAPTDGSELSNAALEQAVGLAKAIKAKLTVLTC